jgi:hypothetical protein
MFSDTSFLRCFHLRPSMACGIEHNCVAYCNRRKLHPKQKGGCQIDLVHIYQDFDRYKVLRSRMLCNSKRSGFDIQDPFGTAPAANACSRLRVPAPNDQNSFLSGTRLARVASPRAESRASRLLWGAFHSPIPAPGGRQNFMAIDRRIT